MNYRNQQKIYQEKLIDEGKIFEGVQGNGIFFGKERPFVLKDSMYNLYFQIRDEVCDYFKKNDISWWRGKKPNGHTLSSQIACLNHLYLLRNDKQAVLEIAKTIFQNIDGEAVKIEIDKYFPSYITFEYVNNNKKYLKERYQTRGANCTSIDAFIKIGNVAIGIEWKYTETDWMNKQSYWNDQEHQNRYKPLLKDSNIKVDYDKLLSCQMYYELLRQTLLLEQMQKNGEIANYKNVVVCPKGNKKLFECCTKWKEYLKDETKYEVIDPKDLLANINQEKYNDLLKYLSQRYQH
ncbi:MAG: hypothetical protein LBM25_04520 [Bacteroidales bacterium]|jgi:hypothetical protein|nr:hypothetical protein [Bacteroidales bacterium]